ncbi:putative methyltransferase [Bienertia sinuspersici]
MAGLFDKQADLYVEGRPNYPKEWFSWLSDRTSSHSLAWDVGTGNGQAAISVAEHYNQVIATDISESQITRSIHHPRVKYLHTPTSLTNDDLISLIGSENSVDLITAGQAVHWFDLPNFYSLATRLLKKPGGVIAVWCYNGVIVDPTFDPIFNEFHKTTLPYWDPKVHYVFDGYKTLPFPFEDVGLGSEGRPIELEIPKTVSFEGFLRMVKSWSAVTTAKEKGVDLLDESVVKELMNAWGGSDLVRSVVYKAFMIAGKVN